MRNDTTSVEDVFGEAAIDEVGYLGNNNTMNNDTAGVDPDDPADPEEAVSYTWMAVIVEAVTRKYILTGMCAGGVLFNLVSAVILLKNGINLKRSLAYLFAFLNVSDTIFLVSIFLVFSLPRLSAAFANKWARILIPFLLPILQTSLTISVYTTVTIAICGWLYIRPLDQQSSTDSATSNGAGPGGRGRGQEQSLVSRGRSMFSSCRCFPDFLTRGRRNIAVIILFVIAFGFLFNLSRWYEMETVLRTSTKNKTVPVEVSNSTENTTIFEVIEVVEEQWILRFTALRQNPIYVQYYSLIGSCFVMVFIPVFILISTYYMLKRNIPTGSTKKKTMRIMAVIIIMFLVCHMPKVALTGYELIEPVDWPVPMLIANEVNSILLVFYSACNPLAYCGELIMKKVLGMCFCCFCCCPDSGESAMINPGGNPERATGSGRAAHRVIARYVCPVGLGMGGGQGQNFVARSRGRRWGRRRGRNRNDMSEYDAMKSFGITLGGPDPIVQQLHELDAQSRLMCGILLAIGNDPLDDDMDLGDLGLPEIGMNPDQMIVNGINGKSTRATLNHMHSNTTTTTTASTIATTVNSGNIADLGRQDSVAEV